MAWKIVETLLGKKEDETPRPPSESQRRIDSMRQIPTHESRIVDCGDIEITVDPTNNLSLLTAESKADITTQIAGLLKESQDKGRLNTSKIADLIASLVSNRLNALQHGWSPRTLDVDLTFGEDIAADGEVDLEKIYQVFVKINVETDQQGKEVTFGRTRTLVLTIAQNPSGYTLLLKPASSTSRSNTVAEYGYK